MQKEVSDSGTSSSIQPSSFVHTWIDRAVIDTTFCNANVDFNVPGLRLTVIILITNSFGPGVSMALKSLDDTSDMHQGSGSQHYSSALTP